MKDISDPTYVAELVEFAESMQIELDAIGWQLLELIEVIHKFAVDKSTSVEQAIDLGFIGDDLEVPWRKLLNLQKGLTDLLGEYPAPPVLQFEEVDR